MAVADALAARTRTIFFLRTENQIKAFPVAETPPEHLWNFQLIKFVGSHQTLRLRHIPIKQVFGFQPGNDAATIHATLIDAMRAENWSAGLPTNALLISSPSKTADIQQTLAYGAHGPKELVVLLREDA